MSDQVAPPLSLDGSNTGSIEAGYSGISEAYSVSDLVNDLSDSQEEFQDCDDKSIKSCEIEDDTTTKCSNNTKESHTNDKKHIITKTTKSEEIIEDSEQKECLDKTRKAEKDTLPGLDTPDTQKPLTTGTAEQIYSKTHHVKSRTSIEEDPSKTSNLEDVYGNADQLLKKKRERFGSKQNTSESRDSKTSPERMCNPDSNNSDVSVNSSENLKTNNTDYEVTFDEDVIYENVSLLCEKQKVDTLASGEHYGWSSSEFEDYDESPVEGDRSSVTSKERGSEGSGPITHQNSVMKLASKFVQKSIKKHANNISTSIDEDTVDENALFLQIEIMQANSPACLPSEPPSSTLSNASDPSGTSYLRQKRRHIVSSILDSENSFVSSLVRLVQCYEKPLLQAVKPIISIQNCRDIFYKIKDILYCHQLFNLELNEYAKKWDDNEEIGRVFAASFSKSTVFEAYSDFVKNFSKAIGTARKLANNKPAFANFLATCENESADRLSFFGLMVKPVQRFPQFIMLFQDLLHHTSSDHKDRMLLQMALTELEILTLKLNESKREADTKHEAERIISNLSGIKRAQATQAMRNSRFSNCLKLDNSRHLIRSDPAIEIDDCNGEVKEKERMLFLMNDMILCTSKTPKLHSDISRNMQYTYKWSALLSDCTIIDNLSQGKNYQQSVAGRPTSSGTVNKRRTSSKSSSPDNCQDYSTMVAEISQSHPFKRDVTDIVYDIQVMEDMMKLSNKLRLYYKDVNKDIFEATINILKLTINQRCTVDDCLLQISIPEKNGKTSVRLLQMESSLKRYYWLTDIEDGKLSRESWNSPAWYIPENDNTFYISRPLFVKPIVLDDIKSKKSRISLKSSYKSSIQCATTVCIPLENHKTVGIQNLWLCNGDSGYSQVSVISLNTSKCQVIESFKISDHVVTCCEYSLPSHDDNIEAYVWHGTKNNSIVVCEVEKKNGRKQHAMSIKLKCNAVVMRYFNGRMYVGLDNGHLLTFHTTKDNWDQNYAITLLSKLPLTCLFEIGGHLWASSGQFLYSAVETSQHTPHKLTDNVNKNIACVAKAGVGILVCFAGEATIYVYHGENLRNLQDIDISSALNIKKLAITALKSCSGLLWIGTNCGRLLTLPLPRLQGVPKIRGRPCVALHSHSKDQPVRFVASVRAGLQYTCSNNHSATLRKNIHEDKVVGEGENEEKKQIKEEFNDCENLIDNSQSLSAPCLTNASDNEGNVKEIYDSLMNTDSCSEIDVNAIVEANGEEKTTKQAVMLAASKVDKKSKAFVSNMKSGWKMQMNQHKSNCKDLEGKPKRNVKLANPSTHNDTTITSRTKSESNPDWYNKSTMIASGGDGCVKWSSIRSQEVQSADVKTACVLLWKCRH